jgi:tartrate dehydratase beta subunit/fumarate hydratase class I family protein
MKTILKYSLLALAFSLTTVRIAHAAPTTAARTAPEVDPSLAMSGLALLVGSLSVARARRSKG